MPSLGTMKSRIATDLDRTDLSSQIATAITDAIAIHERERFWFNESRDLTFSTVDGQRIYTSSDATWIPDIIEIDALFVTVSGDVRQLYPENPLYIEAMADTGAAESYPTRWAYYNKSIYLYPTPDAVYTVRAMGHRRLAALTGDDDTNAWTTEAEQLIRKTAKVLIATDLTGDTQESLTLNAMIKIHLDELRAETSRRKATSIIRPTEF